MATVVLNHQERLVNLNCITSLDEREAVMQELEAICADPRFSSSRRNCEFLRLVVSETLEGRESELKERTLGIRLFARPVSYDTGSDAVVRVRANDLRKRLTCYYEEHTSTAGLRIKIPLHSYIPVFQPEPHDPQAEVDPRETQIASIKDITQPILSLSQMMQPTLVTLFLCAAIFRWEMFSATPYLDFWTTLLSGRSVIVLVLDSRSSDSRVIPVEDLNLSQSLLKTAIAFHTSTQVASSADLQLNRAQVVPIHVTHEVSPGQGMANPEAAYIKVIPGNQPELWISATNPTALKMAIDSISNSDGFPYALEGALQRHVSSLVRLSHNSNGQISAVVTEDM